MPLTEFENQYQSIYSTELWKIFKEKVNEERLTSEFQTGVEKICKKVIEKSKTIIQFFPTFTLHDEVHIVNVCRWMTKLMGNRADELNAHEAALLLMSACCHDVGMCVDETQKARLRANPASLQWTKYFREHLKDDEEYSRTSVISDAMLRSYVRLNHPSRVSSNITNADWSGSGLVHYNITHNTFCELCASHGKSLNELKVPAPLDYDLRLCAVLLRIADILDFDSSRAPETLFHHLGLDKPETLEQHISATEWAKNRCGHFTISSIGKLMFFASFDSLQLEYEVRDYLKWVQTELDASNEALELYKCRLEKLELPTKIEFDDTKIDRNGYRFGDFHLTMDQDRVIELLTGRNIYQDYGVFVRELIQNAIDAVLDRCAIDPSFEEEDGKIVIRTWEDEKGESWFRIEDNGTGMDENIITNYFLKVGRSYYTSDDFKAEHRHSVKHKDYSPISRFGIGILSCFMSDPENNRLEVSTKRFSTDDRYPNPAIRMNVEGLHGYY